MFGPSTPSTGCYISFIVTGPVLESRENQKAGTARIATLVTRKERCINFFQNIGTKATTFVTNESILISMYYDFNAYP